jgi:hypothetical protein
MASRPTPREAIPLLSDGEAAELVYHRPPHPCRNATMLLVVSLLVNALCMSAIMTQEMEHSAEHLVKTNQLHAVDAATAKHALAHVDSRSASSPSAFSSTSPAAAARSGPPAVKARAAPFKAPLSSAAAVKHKKRAAVHAMTSSHLAPQKPVKPGRFNIEEFRLALLKRRAEREEGKKPTTPLRSPIRLHGAGDNPNDDESTFVVDKRGAFYDPKLKVMVDARLLGTRAALDAGVSKGCSSGAFEEEAVPVMPSAGPKCFQVLGLSPSLCRGVYTFYSWALSSWG